MVKLVIVSLHSPEPIELDVDDEMTVAEAKVLLGAMTGLDASRLTLNVRGANCLDDNTWGALNVQEGEHVFLITQSGSRSHSGVIPHLATRAPSRGPQIGGPALEPVVDALASNPGMVEFLLAMNPELRELCQTHPEMRQALSDPGMLRDMLRTAVDPAARNQMIRDNDLRLAQLSNIPGGTAMLEQYLGGILSQERSSTEPVPEQQQPREESAAHSTPQAGRVCNNAPLPNPWGPVARPPGLAPLNISPVAAAPHRPSFPPPAHPMATPPLDLRRNAFPHEMAILREMGFTDESLMIEALLHAHGDIGGAVSYIDDHSK